MNCCKHKYFVIYRGDDTDFPGNQELIVELNTERDLTGCSAHFQFQGFTQDFAEIPSDKKLRLVIPNSATGKFALGAADAKLWLTNGTKVRTVENRIHVVVTNRVDEAYDNDDPQAITVSISSGGGGASIDFDEEPTEGSRNAARSGGIWSWVTNLLTRKLDKSDVIKQSDVTDSTPDGKAADAKDIKAKLDDKRDETDLSVYDFKFRFDFGDSGIVTCFEPEWNEEGYWYTYATDGDGKEYACYAWGEKERDSYLFDVIGVGPSGGKTFTGFRDVKYKTTDTLATTNGVNTSIAANEKTGTDKQIVRGALLDGGRYWEISVLQADTADLARELASEYWTEPAGVSGRPTTLSGYGITDAAKLAMLLPPAFAEKTSGSYEEGEIVLYNNEAYKRNDTAGDDTSWVAAHWTSATDDDLAARLKCLKNDGFATDEFATNLLGKPVANIKANSSAFAPEYDATSAYSVGAFVYHDGNIYQCKAAIADGGEAWNAEHWELMKLFDFFTNSNSLLNGRLAYSRNATGLKDRAFNTLSFDGTEFNLSTALEGVTPTASGQPRDLLIVATATAATTISFTAGTIKGDKPTIDGAGTWLITLTEYEANTWYCRQIKMEDAA